MASLPHTNILKNKNRAKTHCFLIKQPKFSVEMVKRKINLSNLDHINGVSAMVTKLNR